MVLLNMWNIFLWLLMSATVTGNILSDNDTDIVDAIAGERVIIGIWPLSDSTLSIHVKMDNTTRLTKFLDENIDKHTTVQNGSLILKYNYTIKEVSLMFDKVSKEDEGLYEIEESLYRSKEASREIETEGRKRKDGSWRIELNVLGRSEVMQGYAGENIIMQLGKTSEQSSLLNYDQGIALLVGSVCSILTNSYLYGRLRCTSGDLDKMYTLTIENVTQRDAGLYEVTTGRDKAGRCFLDIKDKPARAVVGENMKIGWFYNQQGKNRTLLLIHPNREVMVLVPPTNIHKIKSNFQHRLLYNGNTSISFMLFTLLNISQSDAGLYTIETVHGNTIPGSKELIVEDTGLKNITTNEPPIDKSVSAACYVESLVWGASCLVLLMAVCLLCLHRRNSCRLEAAQRPFLEKRETVSIVTSGTIMRPLTMHPLDEVRMDQSVTESDGVCSVILGLHYAASDDITAAHTECCSTYSQVHSEYDKVTINTGIDYNNSSDIFNRMASTVCNDDVLVGSSYVSTFVKTESIDEHEYNGNDQKQISQRGPVSYAKVKNIQKVSPQNTGMGI